MKNSTRFVWIIIVLCNLFSLQQFAQTLPPSSAINLDFRQNNFSGWVGRATVYPPNWPDANNCDQNARVMVNCASASGPSCNGCYSGCNTPGKCTAPGVPVPAANLSSLNPPLTAPGQFYDNYDIVPGRNTLITTSVPDPYTCNKIMTLPAGVPICARLGNGGRNQFGTSPGNTGVGYEIDYLSYTFKVDQSNALLTYKYAVILQDPVRDPTQSAHSREIRPRFNMFVRDSTLHKLIDPLCGKFEVSYDTTIAGFENCSLASIQGFGGNPFAPAGTAYRDWATFAIDLRNKMGNLVTISFNTWDCGWGGHFGYAYIAARTDSMAIRIDETLSGDTVMFCAPAGAYSYSWLPNGETTRCIKVYKPSLTDTFTVISGCLLPIKSAFNPSSVKAKMRTSASSACSGTSINFTDSSYAWITGNGKKIPIVKWEWNFGDGNTSYDKNPAHTYTVQGTYTVTLKVTNYQEKTNVASYSVTILPSPAASFTFQNVGTGFPVNFNDQSTSPSGSITAWAWNFGDPSSGSGNFSTQTNPSHVFSVANKSNVCLAVTNSFGCMNTYCDTIDFTIGIKEPNLVPGKFFMMDKKKLYTEAKEICELSMYDVSGKRVLKKTLLPSTEVINLETLDAGLYTITIAGKEKKHTMKVLVK